MLLDRGRLGQTRAMSIIGAPTRRVTVVATVLAVLALVVSAVVVARLLSDTDESGWSANGITLNTSPPGPER
jgi:hypothetical protein